VVTGWGAGASCQLVEVRESFGYVRHPSEKSGGYRAWDCGEEDDKEVNKVPLNRGDNKPRRCEQHFQSVPFRINFAQKLAIVS